MKIEVLKLETTEISCVGYLTHIGRNRNDLRHFTIPSPIILDSINVHLYFITKDKIKTGDVFYNAILNAVFTATDKNVSNLIGVEFFKVVTTTDTKFINIPKTSDDVIDLYCRIHNESPIVLYSQQYDSYCFLNGSMYENDGKVSNANFHSLEKAANNSFHPVFL
jgi:hypothetical protein